MAFPEPKTAKLFLEGHDPIDCGRRRRPLIFGIVNLTPDSFSDGGKYPDTESAVREALSMLDAGAFAIDAGAESTRPGAEEIPAELEKKRLVPFVRALRMRSQDAVISVDTRKASVAEAALEAGADIVNDVSAMRFDPAMKDVVARRGAGVVLMHSRGTPRTMRDRENLVYSDVVREIAESLEESVSAAIGAGVRSDRIILDPGLGFAKTPEQDFELVRHASALRARLAFPFLYGPSRKSFLRAVSGGVPSRERDPATLGVLAALSLSNVEFVRVHNVRASVSALDAFIRASGGRRPETDAPRLW